MTTGAPIKEMRQIRLADLFKDIIDTSWRFPIKKIKAVIKAIKAEKDFYKSYPEERK